MNAPRTPLLRLAALVATLVALTAACTGDDRPFTGGSESTSTTVAPPPIDAGLVVLPPGFEPADTRGVVLTPLASDVEEPTAEELKIPVTDEREGSATISGRVTVDGGGHGARVRLERFVGDATGVLDIDTDGSGGFKVEHALGGRYRIRAWDAPEYASIPTVTVFVPADGEIGVDVPMREFQGPRLQLALDTAVPAVGSTATLEALVTEQEIDGEGYLSGAGLSDVDLTLTVGSGFRITSANPTTTGDDGRASWTLVCRSEGAHDVTVEFGESGSTVVTLPTCLPPPETPEPDPSSTTTTTPGSVAVGASFTPPYAGLLVAGRYEPAVDATGCAVTFEIRSGDAWVAVSDAVSGPIVATATIRNVRPAAGTTACRYTRTA